MSICFECVVLENWLVYRGKIAINFGDLSSNEKNIVVVHGLNGFGKTSLLRGIQWAFHEHLPEKPLHECFNKAAIRDGEKDLSVEVHFLVDDISYQLIRRARARLDGSGNAVSHLPQPPELIRNGQVLESTVQETIENILPRECQQFFFFDGLEIKTYASRQRPADIKQAIERVLGIPEVRNLRTDLKKVVKRWEEERDSHLEKEGEYHRLLDELEGLRSDAEGLREDLEEERRNRSALDQVVSELEKRASMLEGIKTEQERLQDLERLKDSKERSLIEQEERLDSTIGNSVFHLLLPLFQKQIARLQTELGTKDYQASREEELRVRKEFLEEILNSKLCVCERDITTDVIVALENKVQEIGQVLSRRFPRNRYSSKLSKRQSNLARLVGLLESDPPNMGEIFQLKQELEVKIQEITQDIATLKGKLSEHGDGNVREVYQQLGEKTRELKDTDERIRAKEERLRKSIEQLERKNHKVNQIVLANKELTTLGSTLDLAMRSEKVAEALVEALLSEKRKAIVENINRVFRNVTNKPQEYDRVELMDDWGVCVVTKNSTVVSDDALSAGEKEVLAFSFIAGLSLSTDRAAPLLMDTPFGHLDNRHRRGLLEALPALPNQVILLATDRDLPDDDIPRLQSRLHRHLKLVRDQQAETSNIQEVG